VSTSWAKWHLTPRTTQKLLSTDPPSACDWMGG
jgi:hypothetical protein